MSKKWYAPLVAFVGELTLDRMRCMGGMVTYLIKRISTALALMVAAVQSNAYTAVELDGLAAHGTWLKLGHYKIVTGFFGGGYRSEIQSSDFFLAPTGNIDPKSEVIATISAMSNHEGLSGAGHAQCRFPGRFLWLKRMNPEEVAQWPVANCTDYLNWSHEIGADSISVYFASGYLGNPASFYGHILVKFNSPNSAATGGQLDRAFNFGAILSARDNALVYVAKGIFGGYDAVFSNSAFYVNQYQYGQEELRDLWEYKLTLPREDVLLVLAHLWELSGAKFRYYFFKKNCAYRFAEIVELVVPDKVNVEAKPWAVPASIFHNLAASKYRDIPLVDRVDYYPSRQNILYEKFDSLEAAEKLAVRAVIKSSNPLGVREFGLLSDEQRGRVLSVMVDYEDFLLKKDVDVQSTKSRRVLFMKEQAIRGRQKINLKTADYTSDPPDGSNKPSLFRASFVSSKRTSGSLNLQIRPVYYDLLSSDRSVVPFSQLEMFDLHVRYDPDSGTLLLKKLDLINVINLNLSQTGLPHDGGFAWAFAAGVEKQLGGCESCLTTYVGGGYGKGVQLFNGDMAAWTLLNGRVETNYQGSSALSLGPTVGIVFKVSHGWSFLGEISQRINVERRGQKITQFRVENRFAIAKNFDIRAGLERGEYTEGNLGLSWYW